MCVEAAGGSSAGPPASTAAASAQALQLGQQAAHGRLRLLLLLGCHPIQSTEACEVGQTPQGMVSLCCTRAAGALARCLGTAQRLCRGIVQGSLDHLAVNMQLL